MGQSLGSLRSHTILRKKGSLRMEEQLPPEMLEFSKDHSQMVSYGIDKQTHPKFYDKTLSNIVKHDAEALSEMFSKAVGISGNRNKVFVASESPGSCTFDGMKKSFIESASKVDTNGIFIFAFSGHGLKDVSNDQWGLAPSDFNSSPNTLVTAGLIVEWLHFVRFQGRFVLLILDCCYAGGIAEQIVINTVKADIPIPGLFVLTSCTAHESSLVITTLGHSIFNFALGTSLYNNTAVQHGRLAIKEVYESCEKCCIAMSSLLIGYDKNTKELKWKTMQPEFKGYQLNGFIQSLLEESDEQTDLGVGRFEFALKYYHFKSKGGKSIVIPDKCQAWLEIVSQSNGPLEELKGLELLNGSLLRSVVASMVYSMASFFVACQLPEISTSNAFIVAFLHVTAAVDSVHREVELTLEDILEGLQYYNHVLVKQGIKSKEIRKLHNIIQNDLLASKGGGIEEVDGAVEASETSDIEIPELTEWLPLTWES